MSLIDEGALIRADLMQLRRELHQDPEVGLQLPKTQAKVLHELRDLDLEIFLGQRTTSVTAVLRGARPGPSVLLRGDMDALPVREETGLDFASVNGNMHACGHDLHTAGLIGAARILNGHREEIEGNVIFMFQPGEEGYNGASIMIEEGVLDAAGDRPVAAYGIHVAPGPLGVFNTRPGPLLAASSDLHVQVTGAGGHGSRPESAVDPVPCLAEIIMGLQAMVTRRFSVFDPVVLTVTQLAASQAINVIPASAQLGATVRSLSQESVSRLNELTKRLAEGIAAAHGCTAEVQFDTSYPVTMNDGDETAATVAELRSLLGPERVAQLPDPIMGSEDFSFVLQEIPGTFVMLSCSPPDVNPETAAYNHSPQVLFDDSVLGDQAAALAALALNKVSASRRSPQATTSK